MSTLFLVKYLNIHPYRNKIQKLMYPEDIKDGEVVDAEFSDLDAELGLDDVSSK